jgi:hypothetical protein
MCLPYKIVYKCCSWLLLLPSKLLQVASDHDAQFLMISDIAIEVDLAPSKWRTRIVNDETTAQF